jgi:hypothetical protein
MPLPSLLLVTIPGPSLLSDVKAVAKLPVAMAAIAAPSPLFVIVKASLALEIVLSQGRGSPQSAIIAPPFL